MPSVSQSGAKVLDFVRGGPDAAARKVGDTLARQRQGERDLGLRLANVAEQPSAELEASRAAHPSTQHHSPFPPPFPAAY